jgi:hypothetical protein
MTYYIFLKSLWSLEEFRKNPHVKIPPKSPSTNFQSLGKFKILIFNSEILFLDFGPADLAAPPASHPSQPTGRAVPRRPKALDRPIQPARRSRLCGKYVFLFRSRLPEPAAFSLCHRHAGPACQFRRLPRAGRPRSEFFPATPLPRAAAPRLGCPRAFIALPHHSPSLIPFKPSINGP